MRVYEFSKQSGISTKQILEWLHDEGIKISSHMSVLAPEEIKILENKMRTPSQQKKAPKKITEPVNPSKKTAAVADKREERVTQSAKSELSASHVSPSLGIHGIPTTAGLTPQKDANIQQEPIVLRAMTVGDAACQLNKPLADVIVTLLRWGIVAAKNQVITEAVLERLAQFCEIPVIRPHIEERSEAHVARPGEKSQAVRLPIVAVLGHVDHGKTTLLDFIRKTRVVTREKGGITQHLGAYEASTPHGNVVFIDTPGHEAFSRLRERGIRVADIVILVVAANDGVMPQTIEAIKQAKSMGVPIIVALNKSDLVSEHRFEVVKRDLSKYGLQWEEWGGDTVVLPISAKTGAGIDQLLEVIVLQAELMDLRADTMTPGRCYVLEAQFEKGRGPVATVLCQTGSVKVGDFFRAGDTVGRISTITDTYGKRLQEVGPSKPVRIAGFETLAQAGDLFSIASKQDYRKARTDSGSRASMIPQAAIADGAIRLILKADTDSSRGAIIDAIQKLSKKNKDVLALIQAGVGDVSESDVALADTTSAHIITFNVKLESNAVHLAKKLDVDVKEYGIIYKLLDDLDAMIQSGKKREITFTKTGEAEVRVVFDIKGTGKIAGSYIRQGIFHKGSHVRVLRGNKKVGEGKIKSLQRDRKSVNEIGAGYECAFIVDGFNDWVEGDKVECLKPNE